VFCISGNGPNLPLFEDPNLRGELWICSVAVSLSDSKVWNVPLLEDPNLKVECRICSVEL
jgi:hypothetical protein